MHFEDVKKYMRVYNCSKDLAEDLALKNLKKKKEGYEEYVFASYILQNQNHFASPEIKRSALIILEKGGYFNGR